MLKVLVVIIIVLVVVYLLGPHPRRPIYAMQLPGVPSQADSLGRFIAQQESAHHLKPDNEARIIWYDSTRSKTPYAIVYLHGFSASQEEGDPVHRHTAKEFGCNLYLTRLAEHGIDTVDQLINLTPDKYWESAKQALMIGKQLGRRIILMATSTGSSLALKLAADYPNDVDALVLMSPNIAIFDKNAWLLNNPWGLQIARLVVGSKYVDSKDTRAIYRQYWNYHYPLEAAVQLEEFLETSMNRETFQKVHQPTLMLYYYKDEVQQDSVVSVPAMKKMFSELGTGPELRRAVALPETGNHVIGCYFRSNDIAGVQRETDKFLRDVLKLSPQNASGH